MKNYRYFGHMVTALIRRNGQLLLVQEQHPDARTPSWTLPAGKVEPGEELIEALRRELKEETGLTLEGQPVLAFTVQVLTTTGDEVIEGIGFHFVCDVSGYPQSQDPDGLVIAARWFPESEALHLLAALDWYDCSFLRKWLYEEMRTGEVYTVRQSASVQEG
jgi:8-oxo-dGTP diphosphatase